MTSEESQARRSRVRRPLIALATFLIIAAIVLLTVDTAVPSTPVVAAQPEKAIAPPTNWKLAFSTDFPGTTLDTSTWSECYPWSPTPTGCSNFGNSDEREWYLPSQVHVENGALALVAQRTPTAGTDVNGKPEMYSC